MLFLFQYFSHTFIPSFVLILIFFQLDDVVLFFFHPKPSDSLQCIGHIEDNIILIMVLHFLLDLLKGEEVFEFVFYQTANLLPNEAVSL